MNPLIKNYLEENIKELSCEARQYYHNLQYFVGEYKIKLALINTLKSRSEYKRALKEYKKQCEEIWKQKYLKQTKEWREHPCKFIEDIYGFKLLPYQKIMLKMKWNRR